ncbi:MAG: sulfate reduction electron transfer complex DsrMKJOP subunit DsrP [Myxococcota bacterium]
MNAAPKPEEESRPRIHLIGYPRFLWRILSIATDGKLPFYAWMTLLTALCLVGVNTWAQQVVDGMVVTNMTDHVSWGLYIANFTFMVGVAAGGVMMVIPAYLYRNRPMHHVVIFGEIVAIAAIVMALAFVIVDLGRPDRAWHMIPGLGRFNWPVSMLTWDVVVLSGYLLLNLHIVGYMLYQRFLGRKPDPRWYVPFVMVSIVWAISIHTVTAFLYSGLGGRPLWNSALLAPRFLVSAFVSGPAFLVIVLALVDRFTRFDVPRAPTRTLVSILRVTMVVNLFMLGSELFTELYSGGSHTASARYLFFGLHGHDALVPWIWTAVGLNSIAAVMLFTKKATSSMAFLVTACVMTFVGVWIEKGMGLIVPGFIPSTLHEVVEYLPSLAEWKVTVGIWAFGLMVLTVGVKVAVPVLSGRVSLGGEPKEASEDAETAGERAAA